MEGDELPEDRIRKVKRMTGDAGSRGNAPGLDRWKQINKEILTHPEAVIRDTLGGTAMRGYIGTVSGVRLIVFLFDEGPYAGKYCTTLLPLPSHLTAGGLGSGSPTEEESWYTDFRVEFRFSIRYTPVLIQRVLRSISSWLSDSPLSIRLLPVPPEQATQSRISEASHRERSPSDTKLDQLGFSAAVGSEFVAGLRGVSQSDGRPISMVSQVESDDALTIKLLVSLHPNEARKALRSIIPEVIGEGRLLATLNELDPTYATMGVEPMTPTLAAIRAGQEHLPASGYYGSQLVESFGKDELIKALNGCPEHAFLEKGGLFLCWDWESSQIFGSDSFRNYRSVMSRLERRFVSAAPA